MLHIAFLLQSILGFHGCHNKDDPSIGGLGDVGPGWSEISAEMVLENYSHLPVKVTELKVLARPVSWGSGDISFGSS